MRLACAAVISPANAPMHVASFPSSSSSSVAATGADDARLHHRAVDDAHLRLAHAALDEIEARLRAPPATASAAGAAASGGGPKDPYLGEVHRDEGHVVYAHVGATAARFVLVMATEEEEDDDDASGAAGGTREETLRGMFRALSEAYADAVSDPFHAPGGKIASEAFARRVRALADAA
jgi:hypothetical protein